MSTTNGEELCASIIQFLTTNFQVVGFIDQEMHHLNSFARQLPFCGRTQLIESAQNLYKERIENRFESDRNRHPFGLIGGCPRLGKTRALVELSKSFGDWVGKDKWTVGVVISYNNGNPPTIDYSLCQRLAVNARNLFACRILYFAFLAGKSVTHGKLQRKLSFEHFLSQIPYEMLKDLSPSLAIDCIISFAEQKLERKSEFLGGIFIGIDEANYLLDPQLGTAEDPKAFLRATLVSASEALLSSAVFCYGIVAGTLPAPVELVFSESMHKTKRLPMSLLEPVDLELVVDSLALNYSVLKGWRTVRRFRTMLVDVAVMPRSAEEFLEKVINLCESSKQPLDALDYSLIQGHFVQNVPMASEMRKIALTLVINAMLAQPIRRHDVVTYRRGRSVVEADNCLTYGDLEAHGAITLSTASNESLYVQLPYWLFRELVGYMDGSDELTVALRALCDFKSQQAGLSWQDFETLCVSMDAVREMMLCRINSHLEDGNVLSANELYCVDSGSGATSVDDELCFLLRERCGVVTAHNRFPPPGWIPSSDSNGYGQDTEDVDIDPSQTCVKNCDGAPFDCFTQRKTPDGVPFLVCGQQKFYFNSILSKEAIQQEAEKVQQSLENSEVRYILVVMATRLTSDALEDLPENCIVVSGNNLAKFFGPIMCGRLSLYSTNLSLNVNIANKAELKTIPGIGEILSKQIVNKRKERAFTDWDDLVSRISRIPTKARMHLSF